MNKRMEVEACIATLVQLTDEHSELDGLCALLCAVGAACGDTSLEAKLIDAISPIMVAAFIDMTAGNN